MLAFLRWAGWARKASKIYLRVSEKMVGESLPGLICSLKRFHFEVFEDHWITQIKVENGHCVYVLLRCAYATYEY